MPTLLRAPGPKGPGGFFDISDNTGYIDSVATKSSRARCLPWLACLLALVPLNLPADIYKQVLPDGTVSYTSEPSPSAEKVVPPPLQVIPEAEPLPGMDMQEETMPEPEASYTRLSIMEPANDQVIWSNEKTVSVGIAIEPRLQASAGHRLVLLLDGNPVNIPADDMPITLNDVDRGTHMLSAEVHDAEGRALIQSPPVTFHLKQHSTLLPPRAAPK